MKRLEFSAFDTLFFREARPMESVGAKPLAGRFPPTARSMSGAVRSLVGEAMGVDWQSYRNGEATQQAVREVIGAADAEGLGALRLRGPFPVLNGERLYPVPLHCLQKTEGEKTEGVFLQPGKEAVQCDLGKVYLPELQAPLPGAKPLEKDWLTRVELESVLGGGKLTKIVSQGDLFKAEPRLGIALNGATRSVEEGKLYQTIHARTHAEVTIGVEVSGLPESLEGKLNSVVRLGGEGRFAAAQVGEAASAIRVQAPVSPQGIVLVLLSAADFGGGWLPPGFNAKQDEKGATVWQGEVAGVALTLRCAVLGKAVREGGWDMQKHCSRPAVSLIPAGSVYFCMASGDLKAAAEVLQGKQLGLEQELGRGELAVGYW